MKFISSMALPLLAALGLCSQEPPETKDRLSPERMERLVEAPMAAMREQGLRAGDAKFEQLRATEAARSGPASTRVADLLTAYGVGLYMEWRETDDRALLEASRNRLHAAVSVHRRAFGPAHPEVAVALHSFADVDILHNDGRATPQAHAALREALRIRRVALGPDNHETRATEDRLMAIAGAERWKDPDAVGRATEEAYRAAQRSDAQARR